MKGPFQSSQSPETIIVTSSKGSYIVELKLKEKILRLDGV